MPQTIYRYHPMTGVYAGRSDWTPPYPGIALPGNATTEAPPECEAGTVAVYRDGAWVTLEDHRGETVYRTDTATAITITDLGVLPDGVTSQMPPDYPIWDAKAKTWTTDLNALADARRNERDARIAAIMWRVQRYESEVRQGRTDTTDNIAVLDEYIQKLRDMPYQHGFPKTVEWPEAPSLTD